ncbi:MAG: ATP-binding protein [Lachnospiraceae bacterium]|nr:ATP-binding protein [Lachnospiraceae bacterium]MBO6298058.1 ATP-binding protein [Lachnospiraceae bacterium]MBP3296531.1 ATP-binding protein [Lachnospiraceae bacterium]
MEEQKLELTVIAILENYGQVADFVDTELEKRDVSMGDISSIDIALDEIYANVANYAYGDDEAGEITVRLDFTPDTSSVRMTFLDQGIPYDPLKKPDPDVTLEAEKRQIGGLGIYMVKHLMNEVTYEYRGGMNILRMRKDFAKQM